MNAILFDTLKLAQRLESAGFSHEQATGAAEALAEGLTSDLATKADLDALKIELRGDLRTESAAIRGEIANLRASTANWIITAVSINAALITGLGATLYTLIKASVTPH